MNPWAIIILHVIVLSSLVTFDAANDRYRLASQLSNPVASLIIDTHAIIYIYIVGIGHETTINFTI